MISKEELALIQKELLEYKKKQLTQWEAELTPADLNMLHELTELFIRMSPKEKKSFLELLRTLKKPFLEFDD